MGQGTLKSFGSFWPKSFLARLFGAIETEMSKFTDGNEKIEKMASVSGHTNTHNLLIWGASNCFKNIIFMLRILKAVDDK